MLFTYMFPYLYSYSVFLNVSTIPKYKIIQGNIKMETVQLINQYKKRILISLFINY